MKAPILTPLLASLLLAGCGPTPAPTTTATKAALTITTAGVERRALTRTIKAQGQIAPWQEAIISARVSGLTLVELQGDVGDEVKRGQLLARFDTRTVKAELAQARANLTQATANATQAKANHERVLRMQGKGAISEQDWQIAQTQVEMAEAQREMAAAQVTAQEIRLNDCEVRAVDEGVISMRSATLGQVAPPGTELFRLIRQKRLEWQAQLTPQQLAQISPGQQVTVTLTGGQQIKGKIRKLAPALDKQSRLGMAYVTLENNDNARAGLYASGEIHFDEQESLVVPAESVVLRDGRSSVFRLGENDTVTQLLVVTGERDGDQIEILSGLSDNDQIAVRGAGFLVNGDQVRRVEHAPVAASDITLSHPEDTP